MPSPLSVDLRERVVAAVAEGASFHRAAARFGVSVSSASRWSERFAQEGHVAPKRGSRRKATSRPSRRAATIV
ncbi:helix-turn-helix domain-containing protein, partial [Methylobacterium sp. P5_C11]